MSSIYKKGRDGYYYYQTYVHNSKSGKKDKRIFHSLGTKIKSEAREKQKDYDQIYKKLKYGLNFNILKYSKIGLTIILTSIMTFYLTRLYDQKTLNSNLTPKKLKKDDIAVLQKSPEKLENFNEIIPDINEDKKSEVLQIEIIKDEQFKDYILPEYEIILVEKVSGAFEQGKIYITVDDINNSQEIKSLSLKIREQYPAFSNIIICFYANTEIGLKLAKGLKLGISEEQQQKAWLAMYSYNPVEGEYFDDNPGGYLGAY